MLYEDRLICDLWEGLGNIPFKEDARGVWRIEKDYGPFDAGDTKDEIWHWFDDHHSQGLAFLMKLNCHNGGY